MTEWIYDNSGPIVLAALALLVRLTWSAAKIVTVVEALIEHFEAAEAKNEKIHAELYERTNKLTELHAMHHGRIKALESGRSPGSWPGNEVGQV